MSDKANVLSAWIIALAIAEGFASGDIPDLWSVISGQATQGQHPGYGGRLLLIAAFAIVLIMFAQWSDEGSDIVMVFLVGLTLLFLFNNATWIQGLLSGATGGTGSSGGFSSPAPAPVPFTTMKGTPQHAIYR